METIVGILVIAAFVVGLVAFGVFSWRNSEGQHEHWRSQRGDDQATEHDDRGSYRSHWGGLGRPGA